MKLHLLLILLLALTFPVFTQEAIFESYLDATGSAFEKENYPEAGKLARLAAAELDKLQNPSPRTRIKSLNMLSAILIAQGNYIEAEPLKRKEIGILESINSSDYDLYEYNYPMLLESLGLILSEQNKFDNSEAVYRKALAYREKVFGADDRRIAKSLVNLGLLYFKQKKYDEAEVMSSRALGLVLVATQNKDYTDDDLFTSVRTMRTLSQISAARGDYKKASLLYVSLISMIEGLYGKNDAILIEPLGEQASILRLIKSNIEAAKVEARIKLLKAKK